MLSFDDLRPLLRRLESDADSAPVWKEIWDAVHHQGDISEGSFAAIPHLVRIHRARGDGNWNTFAIAATIELARARGKNPDVPPASRDAYQTALHDLGRLGVEELARARDREAVRAILALLAIVNGARVHGRILLEFTEDEVLELERAAFGES